jgi:beta-lactamase class A
VLSDPLAAELDAMPGTISVFIGRPAAAPAYTRLPDARHYAASTMKVAVLAALYRAAEAGRLDPDRPVPVTATFASAAPGAPEYALRGPAHDNDDAVWQRLGGTAPLRWLARRMIVRSSNLATNLVLAEVGLPAFAEAWQVAGASRSVAGSGIDDFSARAVGITNIVTARDLAALLSAIAIGVSDGHPIAGPAACREMLDVLCAQEYREDLPEGLPPGTRIACKNGWVKGVRHGAGVVFPGDAPPYAIVVCATTPLAADEDGDDEACRLIVRLSAAAWAERASMIRSQ